MIDYRGTITQIISTMSSDLLHVVHVKYTCVHPEYLDYVGLHSIYHLSCCISYHQYVSKMKLSFHSLKLLNRHCDKFFFLLFSLRSSQAAVLGLVSVLG